MERFARPIGATYGAFAVWAVLQLVWIHYHSKLWTLQKTFHVIVFFLGAGAIRRVSSGARVGACCRAQSCREGDSGVDSDAPPAEHVGVFCCRRAVRVQFGAHFSCLRRTGTACTSSCT
jgi:hypothetical protein